MSDNLFVDTNILVYSVADDLHKRAIAEDLLLQEKIVVSPQVMSEFVVVTLRKQILELPKVIEYTTTFLKVFQVTATTANTVTSALEIIGKYHFSYWDSLILASALESTCSIVYSEDLQDGQRIEDRLTIMNPFK